MKKLKVIHLYKCLADLQRLRILRLLQAGELCVCHLQTLLEENQVKVSKQLQYLRRLGLVEARRDGKWMYYALTQPLHPLLQLNLEGLASLNEEHRLFEEDAARRTALNATLKDAPEVCQDAGNTPASFDTSQSENPIPAP